MTCSVFQVSWLEDSTPTIRGRLASDEGTGEATGVNGEGYWLKQADLSTITCKVFDLDGSDPDTPIGTPTVTISSAVLDTPVTNNISWKKDKIGYNFEHRLSASLFANSGRRIQVEYKGTTSGGSVFHGIYRGPVRPVRGS